MNILSVKSFKFAMRVTNLYNMLCNRRNEYVIAKQVLHSSTSIDTNVREALNAESSGDLVLKLYTAQKECEETCYWLTLLYEMEFIGKTEFESIHADAQELLQLIRSIILTTKK